MDNWRWCIQGVDIDWTFIVRLDEECEGWELYDLKGGCSTKESVPKSVFRSRFLFATKLWFQADLVQDWTRITTVHFLHPSFCLNIAEQSFFLLKLFWDT